MGWFVKTPAGVLEPVFESTAQHLLMSATAAGSGGIGNWWHARLEGGGTFSADLAKPILEGPHRVSSREAWGGCAP